MRFISPCPVYFFQWFVVILLVVNSLDRSFYQTDNSQCTVPFRSCTILFGVSVGFATDLKAHTFFYLYTVVLCDLLFSIRNEAHAQEMVRSSAEFCGWKYVDSFVHPNIQPIEII